MTFFKKIAHQPKRQLLLSLAAEALAVVAFGLFFAKGVTDAGGDGLESFKITFFVMSRSFYLNVPLFIGFIFPMFILLFTFIPNKNSKVYLVPAFILLACGVMVACTYPCYLLPFTEEYAEMVDKSGVHISAEAAVAAAFIILAALLTAVKAFSPAPAYSSPAADKEVKESQTQLEEDAQLEEDVRAGEKEDGERAEAEEELLQDIQEEIHSKDGE